MRWMGPSVADLARAGPSQRLSACLAVFQDAVTTSNTVHVAWRTAPVDSGQPLPVIAATQTGTYGDVQPGGVG